MTDPAGLADFENMRCPADIHSAISWLCTLCGRGRMADPPVGPIARAYAPEEVVEA